METYTWFAKFKELVLAGFTITAIKDQLALEGFDLRGFVESTLINTMINIVKEK